MAKPATRLTEAIHARESGLWPSDGEIFDRSCTACPRLATFLAESRAKYPKYYCAPVAPFGDSHAELIIVGLAPGLHGANATGRPFTGDHAGLILYRTLYETGFSNQPESTSKDDPLRLLNCRISNSVKCVPPQNKPLPAEILTCNRYLATELRASREVRVFLALGSIAHNAALRALGLKPGEYKFAHGAEHVLPDGRVLLDSYHCSRYNTQTRRLTEEMFRQVFQRARTLIETRPSAAVNATR